MSEYTFHIKIKQGRQTLLNSTIAASGTAESVARAKKSVQRLLNEHAPVVEKPNPPLPEPPSPPVEKKTEGTSGVVHLCCPACGSIFGSFLRERQSAIACRCGHSIDLTVPLARYHFTCPSCAHEGFGKTNMETAAIAVRCKCGTGVDLTWVPEVKEYRN